MNKISQHIINLILLLTVSFGQLNKINQKSLTQKIHDNILQALIMNQFSEGARPTEEIRQLWSVSNNQWENSTKYTYEYSLAKSTMNPVPGLVTIRKWVVDPNTGEWKEQIYYTYAWNNDGTQHSWTSYNSASGAPIDMTEYSGPYFNGQATTETAHYWSFGAWAPNSQTRNTFDQYGNIIQEDYFGWTGGVWNHSSTTTNTMDPNYEQSGCPQTSTWSLCTNGTCDPYYEYRIAYGQPPCPTDAVPYNVWLPFAQCNPDQVDFYWFEYGTANHGMTDYYNYPPEHCLVTTVNGYDPTQTATNTWNMSYHTPGGGVPKTSTAFDNSDSRLTQVETATSSDGTNWTNSQRNFYAYEGIPLGTEDNASIPAKFVLDQNYPNPFNPITSISFELPEESIVSIKIYNSLGDEIKTLINEFRPIGQYQINWDGTNNTGEIVSGGTYFYQLKVGEFTQTRKMVLLK